MSASRAAKAAPSATHVFQNGPNAHVSPHRDTVFYWASSQGRKFLVGAAYARDGLVKRIAHALFREATAEQIQQARARLEDLRKQIAAKQLTFAEAARRHSDSPTADKGGDLGFFPWQGRMPQDFTRQVFGLKPGEMSQPFQTSFGMHLVLVTDIRPGQFSLEDVRSEVLRQAGQDLWDTTVAAERKKATIRWSEPGDSPAP